MLYIWPSIFKFLFLKGASTHSRSFCCCLKFIYLFFFVGGLQREACEKEYRYWKNEIRRKKWRKFLMETDKSMKGHREEEFYRHRERWWLVYNMRPLAMCSHTIFFFFVLERRLISLRCWNSKFALLGKK